MSASMEPIKQVSVRDAVASRLRKAILSGKYEGGEKLSVPRLAEELGVSRTPVREAFQVLSWEGFLEVELNKSAIVTRIDKSFICDHYEVRVLLETEAVALAAVKGSSPELLRLRQASEQQPTDEESYSRYNHLVHQTIWKTAGNQRLAGLLGNMWHGPSGGNRVVDPGYYLVSIQEHNNILSCIIEREPEEGRRLMRRHIMRSMEHILQHLPDRR